MQGEPFGFNPYRKSAPSSEPPSEKDEKRDEEESRFFSEKQLQALRREIEKQSLPVREHRAELVDAIVEAYKNGKPLLFQGETGSGKSIYSPGAVREALKVLGLKDRTIMMQPRKDATTSIATAVAAVEGESLGKGVGFSTSEAKELNANMPIGVVTPGIFLRYAMAGKLTKEHVGAVIIDELHEGGIDYHLVMGMIKLMMEKGEAPLVLLTSATLHKEKIQEFYGLSDEEYLRIEGRAHPVDKYYLSDEDLCRERPDGKPFTYIDQCAEAVKIISGRPDDGDVLVFMPGVREIDETIESIGKIPGVELLALHGNLHPKERQHALSGERVGGIKRRVIVCTNIAETSLTVPGVKFVVDSGRKRMMRFDPGSGVEKTFTEFVSKSEAEQRAGRAGRIQAGIAVRAMTEEEYQRLPEYAEPEIARKNSALLVLRLKQMGIHENDFPFPDPPDPRKIAAAKRELASLGALDLHEELTDVGRQMLDLPFEPGISKMVIESKKLDCVETALILAAFTHEKNILLGPSRGDIAKAYGMTEKEKKEAARLEILKAQKEFIDENSDWITLKNIFVKAVEQGVFEVPKIRRKRPNQRSYEEQVQMDHFYDWCRTKYIKPEALINVAFKLREHAGIAGIRFDQREFAERIAATPASAITSVLLHAFSEKMYHLTSTKGLPTYERVGEYQEMVISPGSVVFSKAPQLCITNEVKEGTGKQYDRFTKTYEEVKRNYGQLVHAFTAEDLKRTFPERVKSMSDDIPYYDVMSDTVVRRETTTYSHGRRSIPLGSAIVAVEAGEQTARLLARAICYGHLRNSFHQANTALLSEIDQDDLFSEDGSRFSLENWYAERLQHAVNKADVLAMADQLSLARSNLLSPERAAEIEKKYPSHLTVGGVQYPISYSTRDSYEGSGKLRKQRIATIRLPVNVLVKLSPHDIPEIGGGERVEVVYAAEESMYVPYSHDLLQVQSFLVERAAEDAFREWYEKSPQRRIRVDGSKPLPLLSTLEAKLIQYYTNTFGDAVYAYPTYRYAYGIDDPKDVEVVYVRDRDEAERQYRYAEDQRRELWGEKKRQQETVKAAAKEPEETPMQRALRLAAEKKQGKKTAEPVVAVRKIEADQPREDVMTPEIRRDFEERIEIVETLLEQAATYGVKTAKEVSKKETAKEKAKVAVYERVKELRKELKEIREALTADGALPSRLDGKVAALRQSTDVLLKKNLSQIVPNYADRWVELFELAWKSIPEIVDTNTEVGEYIKEGMIDRAEFIGRIQQKLKAKMEQMQKGEVDEGMVENLVEQTFGEY